MGAEVSKNNQQQHYIRAVSVAKTEEQQSDVKQPHDSTGTGTPARQATSLPAKAGSGGGEEAGKGCRHFPVDRSSTGERTQTAADRAQRVARQNVTAADTDETLNKLRAFVMEHGGSVQTVNMGAFYTAYSECHGIVKGGKVRGLLQERRDCGLVYQIESQNKHFIRAVPVAKTKEQQPDVKQPHDSAGTGTPARQGTSLPAKAGSGGGEEAGKGRRHFPVDRSSTGERTQTAADRAQRDARQNVTAADTDETLNKLRAFVMEHGGSIQTGNMGAFYTAYSECHGILKGGKVRGLLQERRDCGLVYQIESQNKHFIRAVPVAKTKEQQPDVKQPHDSAGTGTPAGQGTSLPLVPPARQGPSLPLGVEYELVSTMGRLQELIATDAALGGDENTMVALDCEMVPEELQLMQIATAKGVAVIDCGTIGPRAVCEALSPLLTSSRTLKLLHDLKMDAVAIHALGGVTLNGCMDSQLCMEALTGNMHMGFNPMLAELGLDAHPSKRQVHASMGTSNIFAARPLPAHLLEYAALDAALLYDSAGVLLERIEEARVPVSVLRTASDSRARLAISAMVNFGAEAARRRRVCFDTAHGHRLASRELLEAWRPDDVQASTPIVVFDDVGPLVALLPKDIAASLLAETETALLSDINLDFGRRPHAWCAGKRVFLSGEERRVTRTDIQHIVDQLGGFGTDNRAGLEQQLHRISAIRNRENVAIGLTMRVGRHVHGNADMIADILLTRDGRPASVLLLGEPGSGKTTVVREVARMLAERCNVVIVDTSNEIAGDGDLPHPCVGHARRMQVRSLDEQGRVMVEGVQNHTPEVIVIDEIGRANEVEAARTCKARGVRIVASAHGDLRKLVQNAALRGLVGGVENVVMGDAMAAALAKSRGAEGAEARRSNKLVAGRAGPPVFDVIIEMRRGEQDEWMVVTNVADAVDAILDRRQYKVQRRTRDRDTGHIHMALERA